MDTSYGIEEARDLLRELHRDLDAWSARLRPIAKGVEGAVWEEETDAPRNAAAKVQGIVDGIVRADLPELRHQIERALD